MGKPSRSLRLAVATEQPRNFAMRAQPIITLGRRVLPLVTTWRTSRCFNYNDYCYSFRLNS